MRTASEVNQPCALCGSTDTRFLFARHGHAMIDLVMPYRFAECRGCGVHFQLDVELPDDPYLLEKEHTRDDAPDERHYVHWDDDVVARLLERAPPRRGDGEPARLLDFGSGYGDMLIAARRAGYDASGFDVSPAFAEEARRRSGCEVFMGDLADAPWRDATFDVVNAHFVLEYVSDPVSTVRQLGRLLAPRGVLRVCSYTTDSLAARLRGARWWNYTPTRRFLFCERTLRHLAGEARLEFADVLHGGEQSLVHYLEEHPATGFGRELALRARYRAERVAVMGTAVGSCTSFWLTKR